MTTKPARSWLRITRLPSTSAANASARAAVSSLVNNEVTNSTSLSTGTGLKKWMPTTCSGRFVAMPSFMIGIELVLLARIAVGSVTIASSCLKIATFAVSSSSTASTTS